MQKLNKTNSKIWIENQNNESAAILFWHVSWQQKIQKRGQEVFWI